MRDIEQNGTRVVEIKRTPYQDTLGEQRVLTGDEVV